MLHAAYVYSTCRNGMFNYGSLTVEELNIKLRSECPGFHTYITEAYIPQKSGHDTYKDNDPGLHDPIFASGRVTAYRQPLGLVVSDTPQAAQRVAAQLQHPIQYDTTGLPATEPIKRSFALPY